MNTHNCIKCQIQYEDADPEAYYCPKCLEEKKAIAREIDKKVSLRPKRSTKSELQRFDELRAIRGSNFINIKDLGITL